MNDKLLKLMIDFCDTWLSNLKNANEAAPKILEIRDLSKWRLDAILDHPDPEKALSALQYEEIENEYKNLKTLPMIHNFTGVTVVSSSAATAGTSGYIGYLGSLETSGSDMEKVYAQKYIRSYGDLQYKQKRFQQAKELLQKLGWTNVENHLESARKAYDQYKAGLGERTAASNEIRNLLLKFNGELIYKARNAPGEGMTWDLMATRLSNGNPYPESIIRNQKSMYDELNKHLSIALKDREERHSIDLESDWYNILDFIYSIAVLIS